MGQDKGKSSFLSFMAPVNTQELVMGCKETSRWDIDRESQDGRERERGWRPKEAVHWTMCRV